MVGLSDIALESNAETKSAAKFPYQITLVPNIEATCECGTHVVQYKQCLSNLIAALPTATPVFEIYAKATPVGCPEQGSCGTSEHIGQIVTTAGAVTSKFADEELFFKHQYMEVCHCHIISLFVYYAFSTYMEAGC